MRHALGVSIERFSSGARWEPVFGYSRVVKAGPLVYVAGTTATGQNGELVGDDDAYAQTVQVLRNIACALGTAGASMSDVIQTRIYVTDIERWEEIGRAHSETFREHPPVAALVEVSRLIDPDMLVEIEAVAYLPSQA